MKKLIAVAAFLLMSGRSHAVMITDYYQAGSNMFVCATSGTILTQAGVSVSSPPVSLFNPNGSGVKLVVLDEAVVPTASPAAAAAFSLAYNVAPSSGNLVGSGSAGTVTSSVVGASTGTLVTSKAICTNQGILPSTPVAFRYIGGTTGAAAIGGVYLHDVPYPPGSVVVNPGGMISIQSSSAANVLADVVWIEVPL